ncbi:putative ribosome biogenesis gtp-binding protein [Phaeoacremonium minimum UCRPA7]|uniref:Putative ribosome biogenesis gtp-binding protein n=1 Tax=Phaeoacremonium minimum (strain UCR-PA7) TaxID=1286976 RepID=R8BD37_PHAM7|nr:putative ribosome biogenesis gtp-binding protein [Phaeoacremonium minimum UCRPA7]EON97206.1 putative ribosome biogenesis gtp-binding protein [Phaeoacremonium minimum UCRPA7]
MMRARLMVNILAMPSSLRPLLIEALFYSNVGQHRWISTAAPRVDPTSSPPSAPRALAFTPSAAHVGPSVAISIPKPSSSDLRSCNNLFTNPPPRFLYSAPRFLNVPVNTRIPEVCILGRSNVGKSTLINALTGVDASRAGRSHGAGSKRAGLAITSAKAGCTKMMNAYGFGPPMRVLPIPKVQGEEGIESRSLSRKERREAKDKREKPPAHSLILMDMPGYGLNSRTEWGAEIQKYLARRAMLRGAVVLIDAVAGVKDGDRMVLGLLRDANVRTTIVLTKADKVIFASGKDQNSHAELERRCRHVWEELREIEKDSLSWSEGKGWNRQIWVTGAGDPKYGGMGVDGARLAICQMVGLAENPDFEVEAVRSLAPSSSGRIIPFDQIGRPAQGVATTSHQTTSKGRAAKVIYTCKFLDH